MKDANVEKKEKSKTICSALCERLLLPSSDQDSGKNMAGHSLICCVHESTFQVGTRKYGQKCFPVKHAAVMSLISEFSRCVSQLKCCIYKHEVQAFVMMLALAAVYCGCTGVLTPWHDFILVLRSLNVLGLKGVPAEVIQYSLGVWSLFKGTLCWAYYYY